MKVFQPMVRGRKHSGAIIFTAGGEPLYLFYIFIWVCRFSPHLKLYLYCKYSIFYNIFIVYIYYFKLSIGLGNQPIFLLNLRKIKIMLKLILLILVFGRTIFAGEVKSTKIEEPLPVNLLQISGLKTGSKERTIYWKTSQEKNFDYFEIERSIDTKTFEKAGTIKSTGNNKTGENYYEFADGNSNESKYYRLKMVDLDGTRSYSKVIVIDNTIIVNFNTKEPILGNLYPNPTPNYVTMEMFLIKEEDWKISIYDVNGKLNGQQITTLPIGLLRYTIGGSILKPGLNIIIMESNSIVLKKCIIKY